MPDQKGHCLPEWKQAKERFEKNTSKKKPTDRFLIFFRKGNDLASTLEKMDKAYDGAVKQSDPRAGLKQWQDYAKLVDAFAKSRTEYKNTLQSASSKEADNDQLVKELTVLSKTLSMIESGARINAVTKIQLAEKALSTAPKATSKEDKQRELMIDTAKKTVPALKAGIKNGALFAALVKAEPTPETFNRDIQSAARKISQSVANIPKIFDATGDDLGVDTDKCVRMTKVLDAWGSGSRKVPKDAEAAAVLRELGAYVQMLTASKTLLKELEDAAKTR